MKRSKIFFALLALLGLGSCNKDAGLQLPALFTDHMVLQQNAFAAIWGKAAPGTQVTVSSDWGAEVSGQAEADSTWRVDLPTPEAGGPYVLTITAGSSTLTINDVLLGEVWLASGQSNMEMPLEGWPPNDLIQDSEAAIAAANKPNIRMFTVAKNTSSTPLFNVEGSWETASPEVAGQFSATAWFFAQKLQEELSVPVGIIHSSWGGSAAEAWISSDMLTLEEAFQEELAQLKELAPKEAEYQAWLKSLPKQSLAVTEGNDPLIGLDLHNEFGSHPQTSHEDWAEMNLPGVIENTELGAFDGILWFRKDIEIPASWEGQELVLDLGPIDDRDLTFFNGTLVGAHEEGGYWQTPRSYQVKADLVKAGKTTIAVRMIDNQGGGGFNAQADQMVLRLAETGESIPLSGSWKYRVVGEIRGTTLYTFNPETNDFAARPSLSVSMGNQTPTALFNAMLAPLTPYTLKGAIWYQGETNVGRANQYMRLKSMLVSDWRQRFENEELAFHYVQLAPWHYQNAEGRSSAHLREAQRRMMDLPNTGMISTLDVGNVNNIHPARKQEVGERLAFWALANNYQMDLPYSGPLPDQSEVKGSELHLTFTHAAGGLVVDKEVPNQFEIAGADGTFYPAQWKLEGDTLVLSSSAVKTPAYVRYAYRNGSQASLFNAAGLPAPSFSTEPEIQD